LLGVHLTSWFPTDQCRLSSADPDQVICITVPARFAQYTHAMSLVTPTQCLEIVEELRAMAAIASTAEVQAALIQLANRYAGMAIGCRSQTQVAGAGAMLN
jgi:hypothetical protein